MATMELSNGCEMYYELHGDAGRTIMMIHGLGGCGLFWTPHVEPLVEAGWKVLIVDWPGNGRSGQCACGFSIESYVDSFIEIAEKTGAMDGPLVLCGHSAGGVLSQMFYHRAPEKVSGLVLMQTDSHFMPPELSPVVNALLPVFTGIAYNPASSATQKAALGLLRTCVSPVLDECDPLMLFIETGCMAADKCNPAEETAAFANVYLADRLPEISVPVLVVASVFDPIIPSRRVHALHRAIPGSQLKIISRPGHNAALFAHPQANGYLLEYLSEFE